MKTNRSNNLWLRGIALFLSLLMCAAQLPLHTAKAEEDGQAPDGEASGDQPVAIIGDDGEIVPEEDWNEVFPFGTFAFGNHQADIAEPGAVTEDGEEIPQTVLIPVYRYGGTVGKAVVRILYMPAVTSDPDGTEDVYDYAASGKQDVLIEYENQNPLADYQPFGISDAVRDMAASEIGVVIPDIPETVAETDEVLLSLSAPAEADRYAWQANDRSGWQDVADVETDTLPLTWGDLWDFEEDAWTGLDFRCIYEKDGALFATTSLLGETFVSEYPEPEPMPEDLEVPDELGYTALEFENDYDACEFELTFADNETVKYIRVTALDDEISELPKVGLFTILACKGGEMSDLSSTLTLMVSDNDTHEPSALGFAAEALLADRADGAAKVKIVRTGDMSYPVTVHYATEDDTAIAGVDYAQTEGDLLFTGSINEIEISVPLITNADTDEKHFSVVLSDVRGGGSDKLCTIETARTTVTVLGGAPAVDNEGTGLNLATILMGADGTDVSGNVSIGEEALIRIENEAEITGDVAMTVPEAKSAELVVPEATRATSFFSYYKFSRNQFSDYEYWGEWDDLLGVSSNCYSNVDNRRTTKEQITWDVKPDSGTDGVVFTAGWKRREVGGDTGIDSVGDETRGSTIIGYTTTAVDTNYRGTAESKWVDHYKPGDYYDQLLMSFGWVRPGVRKTNGGEARHRYLLPGITLTVGGWSNTRHFGVDESTSGSSTKPNNWDAYCRLKAANNDSWDFTRATKYNHAYQYDYPQGPTLNFGDSFNIKLNFQFYNTWKNVNDGASRTWNRALTESNLTSLFDIRCVSGHRRKFNTTGTGGQGVKGITLIICTANDRDSDYVVIDSHSELYTKLAPTVSIVPNEGGVDKNGNLFVGSQLSIQIPNALGNLYSMPQGGLYMTNSVGRVIPVTQGDDGWRCSMIWDGINSRDLDANYTLYVFYNRTQDVSVDISHSVPRKDNGVDIDAGAISGTWSDFLSKGITITQSELVNDGGLTFREKKTEFNASNASQFAEDSQAVFTIHNMQNVQSVNFHQDPDDIIIFIHGEHADGYAGNADIPLCTENLSADKVTFVFYDADYLNAVSTLTTAIDHVEVYYDKDGNGQIEGWLDEYNIFHIATDGDGNEKDSFIGRFYGDYPDSTFAPILDESGHLHNCYFKVYLSASPRSLTPPPDSTGSEKSQLLPAFIAASTDGLETARLTDEQRMYRYIRSNNTDNVPLYGIEAYAMRTIDIPLGGDVGETRLESVTNGVFDESGEMVDAHTENVFFWEPDYRGNLLVTFASPEPIVDTDNMTGGEVALAGENPEIAADGTFLYTAEGLNKLNGYLGSFADRSGFVIGIQEQKKPTVGNANGEGISSFSDIKPESVTIGPVRSVPDADNLTNLATPADPGTASGQTPNDSGDDKDFQQDFGVKLPSLQFGVGSYATIIMDGYQVGVSVSIPMLQKSIKSKTWGGETESVTPDGANKTSWTDVNGQHDKYTYTEQDGTEVTAEVVTKVDPNDPNKRVKTVVTETKNGDQTTYRKEERSQELRNGQWVGVQKTVTDKNPDVGKSLPERIKDNFKKTSGIDTLSDFCKACRSANAGDLSRFMSGYALGDAYRNAKNGRNKSMGFSASFKVQFAIMFEYNPIDDCHYFKKAAFSASVGLRFSYQVRCATVPFLYFYVKIGIDCKFSASVSCLRKAVYGDDLTDASFSQGSLATITNGGEAVFELDMSSDGQHLRGFEITLNGKVTMEIRDSLTAEKTLTTGQLSGNGKAQDILLKAYDKKVYVKLKAPTGKTVTVSSIRPIKGAESKPVFDGFTITPSVSAEIGIGFGIEILKAEVCVKISASVALTMGGYLAEADCNQDFYMSSFKFTAAIGINITLAFIDYSMDAISYHYDGKQHGTGGYFDWKQSATWLDDNKEIWSDIAYRDAYNNPIEKEPQPPNGINIMPDDKKPNEQGMLFYKADGTLYSFADDAPEKQGWTFHKKVQPFQWEGGNFPGELPQNSDLAEADEDGVYVIFTPEAPKIKLYFSGKVTVYTGTYDTGYTYTGTSEIEVGSDPVKVVMTKGSKLDRYEIVTASVNPSIRNAEGAQKSRIHINETKDITDTERIVTPASDTRAITPVGTQDFELSGYNTSGDAKELVKGLATGYDYLLVPAGGENYVVYPYQLQNTNEGEAVPQLVVSKLVITGDLSESAGLVHPLTGGTDPAYLVLDGDDRTDLFFDATGTEDELLISWITYNETDGYAVKQRRIPLDPDAELPDVEVLYEGADPCTLTSSEDGKTVWVQASGDPQHHNNRLAAWLIAQNEGLDMDTLTQQSGENALHASAVFQYVTTTKINEMYGESSMLNVKLGDEIKSETIDGVHVTNLETATIGGKTVLLYSTRQVVYFDTTDDVPQSVGAEDINGDTERTNIHRLYLRTVDEDGFSPAVLVQTVVDHESCNRNTIASSVLKDGVYSGGSLVKEQADPYFSNLSFTTAAIDETGEQTLAFYEMGGNTWILTEPDINALLSGSGEVALKPIFSETVGTNAEIGSDGENLAVVYTAPIDNSLSNAIFIAWWDKHVQNWGSPTILAMRGLQVYEDRITYDMTPEEAEAAYFGKRATPGGAIGTPDELLFSNLSMSTAKVAHGDAEATDQLIILTTGALRPFREITLDPSNADAYTTYIPEERASLGFYAIAFGAGEQAVGEGKLSFSEHTFSAGSSLMGELGFRNTGTAAIRASEENPATVRLMVTEGGAENSPAHEFATWQLIKNIPSGAQVKLTFESLPLANNLQVGASFYLTVEEDGCFESAFSGTIDDLFVVEPAPELSFTAFELRFLRIKNGTAIFALNAAIANNGSADAHDVFVQFSSDTGEEDTFGNRIYLPIDITGSSLETGVQTPVRRRSVQNELDQGIYHLDGPDGSDIDMGYYRTVTGELHVPIGSYASKEDISGLHLRAEIYSDADPLSFTYGVYGSEHAEYNKSNNHFEQTVKHHTAFVVPDRITTAIGTTLILPVTFDATDDSPELVLTEISDGTPDWTPRMGVCYYDADRKVIVAAPNSTAQALLEAGETPTGVLALKDMSTNTIEAITYRIVPTAEGVNIYRDDATFTFYDANGDETVLFPTAEDDPDWRFLDKGVATGWTGGEPNEVPMNHDLSLCNRDGAYFTFPSVADTMTFYFMGSITVESSVFGSQTFTSSPATINFNNPTGALHTVKVTAKAGTKIDRFVATYKNDPVFDPDPDAPQVLWNRSFPDIASVQEGGSVPMTCYIVDQSGVSAVSFDGTVLSETTRPALVRCSDNLWYFDYTFTENGAHTVRVTDIAGNSSESKLTVGWFNSVLSEDANADAPGLTRTDATLVDSVGNTYDMTASKNFMPWLKSVYALRSDETSKALAYMDGAFSDTPLRKDGGESWKIEEDGVYLVRVDRADGTWARVIVAVDGIDLIPPELSTHFSVDQIKITAVDNRVVDCVTVNGYSLPAGGSAFMAAFPVAFSGLYTVEVADAAGNTVSQVVQVEIPLALNKLKTDVVCANGEIGIRVTVNRSDVIGGEFDPALSEPAQNVYTSEIEIALAPEGTTEAPETGWTAVGSSCTLTVDEGVYEVFIRNSVGETAKYENTIYLFHPMSWDEPTYDWVETETGYTVTATTVCQLDATHVTTETVDVTGVVTWEPTCEETGEKKFVAVFESDLFSTQTKYVMLPAIGHDWDEPTYTWTPYEEGGYFVEAVSHCRHDTSHTLDERVLPESEVTVPATCEGEGEMLYTATFETEHFATQTRTDPIPPIGHKWGVPTYDWVVTEAGYAVTGTTVCEHDATHVGTETVHATYAVVTPPTTKADGLGRWTAVFTDERFTTQTKDIVLPMLQPTFYGEHLPAVDVAEYADGRTLYRYDVRIRNVDVDRRAVGMQVFVGYDQSILTFAEAKTTFTGSTGVNVADGVIRFAWATDGEAHPLPDGTVVLSLYFEAAGPVSDGAVAAFTFAEGTGFAYLGEAGNLVEAAPVLYEDGSITFYAPDILTIAGEDVIANDVGIRENGEILYRYDVRLRDLPAPGLMVNSAQIFMNCDNLKLAFRKAEGPVDWTATEKNGKLLFAWASESGTLLQNGNVILTVWFARGEDAQSGDRVELTFTVNGLHNASSLSFLFANRVVEVEARTVDGSITFEPIVWGDANCDGSVTAADAALILRSIVGLSELTPRGMLNADVDGDGEITAADAAAILRFVVGLIDALPLA